MDKQKAQEIAQGLKNVFPVGIYIVLIPIFNGWEMKIYNFKSDELILTVENDKTCEALEAIFVMFSIQGGK